MELVEAFRQVLMDDPKFWEKLRAEVGEGWLARRKKAEEDLEI